MATSKCTTVPDFTVVSGGTIYQLFPNTDAAKAWASENLPDDTPRLGRSYCVEHRFIGPILDGISSDGLSVSGV